MKIEEIIDNYDTMVVHADQEEFTMGRHYIREAIQSLLNEQLDEVEKKVGNGNRYSSEELRDAEWVVKDIVEDLREELKNE